MIRLFSMMVLLFLAVLPDAMLPIALKTIAMDRYGVSAGQAHWFMAVNLLGAILVLPVLSLVWRKVPAWQLISVAGLLNAVFMAIMAFPIGWQATLVVRALEGSADLVSLSAILGLMGGGTFASSGRRFGLAGMVMMLGLAMGALGGGVFSARSAPAVLLVSTLICLGLAAVSWLVRAELEDVRDRTMRVAKATLRSRWRLALWPSMFFSFGDRAMSAVISVTGVLYLMTVIGISSVRAGSLLLVSLLLMAIGSWPAGVLADRVGQLRVRIICVAGYGGAVAAMSLLDATEGRGLVILMIVLGLAGAGLIPTTYSLGTRSGGGVSDMGAIQASGTAGYFAGVMIAAMQFPEEGMEVGRVAFQRIFLGFAAGYMVLNMLGVAGLLRWKLRPGR